MLNAIVMLAVAILVIFPSLRSNRRGPIARIFGATPLSVFFLALGGMFVCAIVLGFFAEPGAYDLGPPAIWLLAAIVSLIAAWWGPGGVRRRRA